MKFNLKNNFCLQRRRRRRRRRSTMNPNMVLKVDCLNPPVRINLGGKSLAEIVNGLRGVGWTPCVGLGDLNLNTMTIWGNEQESKFWHQPPSVEVGTTIIPRSPHKDSLYFDGILLLRNCPTEDLKVVSTATVTG